MRLIRTFLCLMIFTGLAYGQTLETRLHHYGQINPALVERQLRALIPEKQRVSMNAEMKQVIVIADAETHRRIEGMLRELARPQHLLVFHLRHNRERIPFTVKDAVPITLPVSENPPEHLVEMARARLAPELRRLPAVASALEARVILLKEKPALARLQVTPAVVFGEKPPYEVVNFPDLTMDILLDTENYVELQEKLQVHDFYKLFMQTRGEQNGVIRPVSLLLSFEGLTTEEDAAPHSP